MNNRNELGKFRTGAKPGPGRPRGAALDTRLKAARLNALDLLISESNRGNVTAAAELLKL